MSDKKSFVLRIDPETMKLIEKWASDEFRSVNGQIEWMLNKCLKDSSRDGIIRDRRTGKDTG